MDWRTENKREDELERLHVQLQAESPGTFRVRVNTPERGAVLSPLLCSLAHDLNNHPGAVIGHCEFLIALPSIDSDTRKHVTAILDIAHRAATRINGAACPIRKIEK